MVKENIKKKNWKYIIFALRSTQGWNLKNCGKNLKVSLQMINKYEKKNKIPSLKIQKEILKIIKKKSLASKDLIQTGRLIYSKEKFGNKEVWGRLIDGIRITLNKSLEELAHTFALKQRIIVSYLSKKKAPRPNIQKKIWDLIRKTLKSPEELIKLSNTNWHILIKNLKQNLKFLSGYEFKKLTTQHIFSSKKPSPKTKNKVIKLEKCAQKEDAIRKLIYKQNKNNFIKNKEGFLIKSIRTKLGISLKKLSGLSSINRDYLGYFEKGLHKINNKNLKKIYQTLINKSKKKNIKFKKLKTNSIKCYKKMLNQWKLGTECPLIVNFNIENTRGSKFEEDCYKKIKKLTKYAFRNPVLMNNYKKFIADIFLVIHFDGKNKKVIIECKGGNKKSLRPLLKRIRTNLQYIKSEFKIDKIILITKENLNQTEKQLIEKCNISAITFNEFKDLSNFKIFFKNKPQKINNLFEKTRENWNLSRLQLSKLLNISYEHIRCCEKEKYKITEKILPKINKLNQKIKTNGIKWAHFEANKLLNQNKPRKVWKLAKKYNKIINIHQRSPNKLENKAFNLFKNKGYTVFKNIILTDNQLKNKYEIDIYAIKNNENIIVECKNTSNFRGGNNFNNIIRDLAQKKKDLEVSKAILFVKQFPSEKSIEKANNYGIKIMMPQK